MKMVLQQRQMLKMVMTTELRQAIELLQLSTYELLQFIQQQAEENPLIELVEKEYDYFDYKKPSRVKSSDQEVDPIDFAVHDEKNLYDYLLEQVNVLHLSDSEQNLLHFLILNLDEQGYLTMNHEEICNFLHITEEELIHAKRILHRLEPIGIGASSLVECLFIQAKVKYPDDELLFTVINNYLQPLADKQWNMISRQLNITLEEVNEIFEKIQTLHPKPAMDLSTKKIDYVTPDIFIDIDEKNGSYLVSLNNYYLPEIRFNAEYASELKDSKELSQYVNQHFKKYEWLQRSIEQRRTTILKIMEVIITHQSEFLKKGFRFLKPLTLKEVADEIGMHESTVSRATANKIVQTPAGTFELRHLFSTKLTTKSGNDASQTKVKELIKELIDHENKRKPLSDQKIAEQLKADKGIVISRRTVAKYRDELHIPSSSKRREIIV